MRTEFKSLDKQIYYVKIIIGESCPLRCSYCFVDKENDREMSLETIKSLIDLLLLTPGKNKLLHFLGGEPLLYFEKIREAVPYARELAASLDKDLDITFCTTGIGFTQERIDFIAQNKIYLAWSLDGPASIHNKNRTFSGGKGSFDLAIQHKEKILTTIPSTHIGLALTVDESTVEHLYDSYKYLIEGEGFGCSVNIAPTDGVVWTKQGKKTFIEQLDRIYRDVFVQIGDGKFAYINSFNKEFRMKMLSGKKNGRCLWFYTEAFTNGDILFNPFVHKDNYDSYVVGNINDVDFIDQVKNYIGCQFHNDSEKCHTCKSNYFNNKDTLQTVQLNQLTRYRDTIALIYTHKIIEQAKIDPIYAEYIAQARNHIYV